MIVFQDHLINNDPLPDLGAKDVPLTVVEQIPTDSSSRARERGLSFQNDFTCEHSLPGTQFFFAQIPGIF